MAGNVLELTKIPTFAKDDLFLNKVIGKGAFSTVYLAKIWNATVPKWITVKIPKRSTEDEVRAEVECLAKLNHANVIGLAGIAVGFTFDGVDNGMSRRESHLTWMLMEYADKGDLLQFIEKRIQRKLGTDYKLWTQLSLDIAEGMKYIHQNLIVHCDLHARNCFVNRNNVAKIGDFGLSFTLDTNEDEAEILRHPFGDSGRPKDIPIRRITGARWKAPEFIPGGSFPPVQIRPGDVWAYGVLMFEFWSKGKIPYSPLETSKQVAEALVLGKTPLDYDSLQAPPYILETVERCFAYAPNGRPTFFEIVDALKHAQAIWYGTDGEENQAQ